MGLVTTIVVAVPSKRKFDVALATGVSVTVKPEKRRAMTW
jgi:hypothetical protein